MEQENEDKDLIFHFEDEEQVERRYFSMLSLIAFTAGSMTFTHNGKEYRIDRKVINFDVNPYCIDFYLKLCKL